MAKVKTTAFFCTECGNEFSKWTGQCPSCHAWNTLVEAPKRSSLSESVRSAGHLAVPVTLDEIDESREERFSSGFSELDTVLGGGIVPGSLVLVGGDPGIGKSTLLLQTCRHVSAAGRRVLYISGEESLRQLKMRALRIGTFTADMTFLCETRLETIAEVLRERTPEMVVIDSIQTMSRDSTESAPGSPAQIRECTNLLLQLAKGLGMAVFIVGHVTKEGTVAGPRMLEHMVDTVLYFEGDRSASYRIIRAVKNRFGSTNEIGVFDMQGDGLHEVRNPSEFLLAGRPEDASGTVCSCAMEGTRPILLEIQALVTRTNFGNPRRTAAGADYSRMNLLMAVLEKRAGLRLNECDAYLNIAGGMRLSEPALDLAIAAAVISSYRDRATDGKTVVFGEVGLAGEVRAVPHAERRAAEAARQGFTTCILPEASARRFKAPEGMKLTGVRNIAEAVAVL